MAKNINFYTNKIVIYLRVSTNEQGDSKLGLEAQLELCRRYATVSDKEIIEVFTEIVSGTIPLNERTEFQYALLTAQKHGASLVVAKLDRLARDVYEVSGYINRRTFGASTPPLIVAERPTASEFELNLYASLGQEERRLISERTKAALAVKKAQGAELGKAGRTVSTNNARKATDAAMTRAWELFQQGISYQKITDILNAEGFKTSRGSEWSKQSVYKRMKP